LEIIIATGLVFNNSRMAALYSSAFLMLIFTVYAALIVFNFFKQVPCYCGGIIQGISWAGHLILNVSFLLINVIAILLCSGKKYLCINKGVS
jgi:hypothetical protein